MQANRRQQSEQGALMALYGAAAPRQPLNKCFPKPPDVPKRTLPMSVWSGAYTFDVAPCTQEGSLKRPQAGQYPTLFQQCIQFEKLYGPTSQQLAATAAAWCKPEVPRLAAMQSLPSTAKYLPPISCKYNRALPESLADPATAQQKYAFHTVYSMPSRQESSLTRLGTSLHPDQASNMPDVHQNGQCRYLLPSGNCTNQKHPIGVSVCQPVCSAAELLNRFYTCQSSGTNSNSGSTVSKAASCGGYEQHTEGFDVTSPDFLEACKKLDPILPQALAGTYVAPATHDELEIASSPTQGISKHGHLCWKLTPGKHAHPQTMAQSVMRTHPHQF